MNMASESFVKSSNADENTADQTGSEKLIVACRELRQSMSNLSQQLQKQGLSCFAPPEIEILRAAPFTDIHYRPGSDTSNDFIEGEAYRCKCSFQIVSKSFFVDFSCRNDNADKSVDDNATSSDFLYAVRENGKISPLPYGLFPQANIHIRLAMINLMNCLNTKNSPDLESNVDCDNSQYEFSRLRNNLTSVTFVSSWGDGPAARDSSNKIVCVSDCLVTLHYGPPGLPSPSGIIDTTDTEKDANTQESWKNEAGRVCDYSNFTSLTGRSKGIKITATSAAANERQSHDLDTGILEEGTIHDDLWLTLKYAQSGDVVTPLAVGRVSLVSPLNSATNDASQTNVQIRYEKPATAFQHPNAGVMLTSLHWILNTLSQIVKEDITNETTSLNATLSDQQSQSTAKLRLLEMYCGCGAHTIPLAKSLLLSEIVAVELDERLVNACRHNCRLNNCLKIDSIENNTSQTSTTMVEVFKGDAAEWAAKTLRAQYKQQSKNDSRSSCNYNNFDILLVDPPRDGLDETVCNMALKGTFSRIIYVSCGRRALLRDLDLLCMGGFEIEDLAVIDLFPGTDAVESLVHLKRRQD